MGPIIVKSIGEIQIDCKEQADQLMKERLVIKTKEIDAPIKQAFIIYVWK